MTIAVNATGGSPPDPRLVERLARHRTLASVPRVELDWIVAHGTMWTFEPGVIDVESNLRDLAIVLSGHFAIYVDHGAGPHKVMEWSAGDVTGVLPYSRMGKPPGETIADEPGEGLLVDRAHFPEMTRECPVLTATLVHVMLDRARQFRASELQDEKMLSLGRLSAGLAHELNNPASAAARSARLLADSLAEAEAAAHGLGEARLTPVQMAAVARARGACLAMAPAALSPIQRADREDAFVAWVERHGVDAEIAGPLSETAVALETLDELAAVLGGEALVPALRWVAAGCATRALAADVERAATRIHDLVAAIKRFTYMDRAQVPEPIDLAQSLQDSVALLLHKARKKSASLTIHLEPDLPKVMAIGGDLNQVWMNLIDNALDAVHESGRVSVAAARHVSGSSVVVQIVDNGSGIPAEIRDKLFDPFITSKPVGQGTGLGLDIARQLVRRNRGDIDFESEPGLTAFRVTLPVA
jgi:signal transduction histidine kinase